MEFGIKQKIMKYIKVLQKMACKSCVKRLPSWKLNIKRFVASYSIIRVMACHQNGIIAISTSLLPLIIGKLCIYNFDCCLHGLCKNRNYFRKTFFFYTLVAC